MDFKFDPTFILDTIEDIDWAVIAKTWVLIASGKLSPNEAVYYVLMAHQKSSVLAEVEIDEAKFDEVCVAVARSIG